MFFFFPFFVDCIHFFFFASAVLVKEAVKAHHLLVSKCLYSSARLPPFYHSVSPARRAEPRERPRARAGMQKHRVKNLSIRCSPVSFDKLLSQLTYGNLVMTCLHTVISSAFHPPPHFLGLTIVPITSVIVKCSSFYVAMIDTRLCYSPGFCVK